MCGLDNVQALLFIVEKYLGFKNNQKWQICVILDLSYSAFESVLVCRAFGAGDWGLGPWTLHDNLQFKCFCIKIYRITLENAQNSEVELFSSPQPLLPQSWRPSNSTWYVLDPYYKENM